jgi:hypothetical protein
MISPSLVEHHQQQQREGRKGERARLGDRNRVDRGGKRREDTCRLVELKLNSHPRKTRTRTSNQVGLHHLRSGERDDHTAIAHRAVTNLLIVRSTKVLQNVRRCQQASSGTHIVHRPEWSRERRHPPADRRADREQVDVALMISTPRGSGRGVAQCDPRRLGVPPVSAQLRGVGRVDVVGEMGWGEEGTLPGKLTSRSSRPLFREPGEGRPRPLQESAYVDVTCRS